MANSLIKYVERLEWTYTEVVLRCHTQDQQQCMIAINFWNSVLPLKVLKGKEITVVYRHGSSGTTEVRPLICIPLNVS